MAAQGKGEGGKHRISAASSHQLSNAGCFNSRYLPYAKEPQNHRMVELSLSPCGIVLHPSISLCNATHMVATLFPHLPEKQPPARVLGERQDNQKGTKSSTGLDTEKGRFRGVE